VIVLLRVPKKEPQVNSFQTRISSSRTSDLFTYEQVAAILGTSITSLARWVKEGRVTATPLPSGRPRIHRRELERILGAGAQGEAPDASS
jgi:hypothetical protein